MSAGVFAVACVLPRPALAQAGASDWHFLADGSVGGFGRPGSTALDLGSGMDFGIAGLLGWKFLEIGAAARAGGWVLFIPASRTAVAGLAGIGTHRGAFGGDLLAEGGLHDYSAIGACGICLFGADPGASGTTPYLGLRAGLTYRLPERPGAGRPIALAGVWLFVSRDTATEWVTYSASGFGATIQETQRIGGSLEIGISLRVAGDWELSAARAN